VLTAQQRVTRADLALDRARDVLTGATITAPIAGKVLSVAGQVGAQVSAGAPFVVLVDVADMQIAAAFPEADAGALATGQPAAVSLANHPGDAFAATVTQVDPMGENDGTMVRYGVTLSFDDPPADLLIGQSAAVRVTTGSAEDVLRVPATAVHDLVGRTATVLAPAGAATERRTVGVGLRGDQFVEITSGLAAGDAVVRSW
jgi:HlyD family secretion protein